MRHTIVLLVFYGAFTGLAAQGPSGGAGQGRYELPSSRPSDGLAEGAAIDYFQTLYWVSDGAEKLQKQLGERLPETRTLLRQIQIDATFLRSKWFDWSRAHAREKPYSESLSQDPYYRAIQGSQRELKRMRKGSDEEMERVVKAIAEDLHIKAENCRHSADGLGKEVKVTVHTRKGTEEIAGFEVWCAPVALVGLKAEHIRFPKISSPTIYKNLAPGRYAMWLKKDRQSTEPVPQSVGGKGETEAELDLLAP